MKIEVSEANEDMDKIKNDVGKLIPKFARFFKKGGLRTGSPAWGGGYLTRDLHPYDKWIVASHTSSGKGYKFTNEERKRISLEMLVQVGGIHAGFRNLSTF